MNSADTKFNVLDSTPKRFSMIAEYVEYSDLGDPFCWLPPNKRFVPVPLLLPCSVA
jgi:hypothetical protein